MIWNTFQDKLLGAKMGILRKIESLSRMLPYVWEPKDGFLGSRLHWAHTLGHVGVHAHMQNPQRIKNHHVHLVGKLRRRLARGYPPILHVSVEQPHVPSPAEHSRPRNAGALLLASERTETKVRGGCRVDTHVPVHVPGQRASTGFREEVIFS